MSQSDPLRTRAPAADVAPAALESVEPPRGSAPRGVAIPTKADADVWKRDIFICVVVALAEFCLVMIGLAGVLALPTLLLMHCAIMLIVTLILDQRERHHHDARVLAVAVVTTAVSGPIGASLSAALGFYLRHRRVETELLRNWYERISGQSRSNDVVELHERIQAGRTINPYVDARARFASILRSGPLEEKQRVLSVITQKYHPRFAGLLELALRNQDPPIRVQAAAVAARLRENERTKIRRLTAEAANLQANDVERKTEVVERLMTTLEGGLLDAQDASSGRDLVKTLCQEIIQQGTSNPAPTLHLAAIHASEGALEQAITLLEPLVARGLPEAVTPLHACLVRLRRYAAAATLMEQRRGSGASAQRPAEPVDLGDAA